MGKFSRDKGARGERELIQELSALLGIEAGRNLNQTAVGGADCVEFPGISIEIKRCETLEIAAWWRQCVCNAGERFRCCATAKTDSPGLSWCR